MPTRSNHLLQDLSWKLSGTWSVKGGCGRVWTGRRNGWLIFCSGESWTGAHIIRCDLGGVAGNRSFTVWGILENSRNVECYPAADVVVF